MERTRNPRRVIGAALRAPVSFLLLAACVARPPAAPPGAGDRGAPYAGDANCRLELTRWTVAPLHSRLPARIVSNSISIDREGGLYWNDVAITARDARDYLALAAVLDPRPLFLLLPDGAAPCARVQEMIAAAEQAFDCAPSSCRFSWARIAVQERAATVD